MNYSTNTNIKKLIYTLHPFNSSGGLKQYIYTNLEGELHIKQKYKKRVYHFVSSNAEQLPLMISGKRADWSDMINFGDYYVKLYRIDEHRFKFLNYAHKNPSKITKDDMILGHIRCFGKDKKMLKKIMKEINTSIKNLRTNYIFWEKVLRQFSKDLYLDYIPPEEFYWVKEAIKLQKEIDLGVFDN